MPQKRNVGNKHKTRQLIDQTQREREQAKDAQFHVKIRSKMRQEQELKQLRDELWEEEMLRKKQQLAAEMVAAQLRSKQEMMASNERQLQLKQELIERQQRDV
jgi:hypothetical protein